VSFTTAAFLCASLTLFWQNVSPARFASSSTPRPKPQPTSARFRPCATSPRYFARTVSSTLFASSTPVSLRVPFARRMRSLTRLPRAETKAALDNISPKPISEYIYTLLVRVYNLPVGLQVQSAALNSLGFLFRAYPTLMLNPSSTTIMDSVFKTGMPPAQLQLLKILQDFLTSQAKASSTAAQRKAEKGVKIDELVGNVDGFADSG